MNSVLVTGGAGFIGSELTRILVQSGYRVTVFDNLTTGRRKHVWKGTRFIKGDLRSRSAIRKALDRRYDFVFHLAALHFIPYCNEHPEETLDVNVAGTSNLLKELERKPPRWFFFASTAAVYDTTSRRHGEHDTPMPNDIYGMSKLLAESLIHEFHVHTPKLISVIGRLYNAYGPRETNPHLIPSILTQLKKRSRVLKLGNLWPYRDYVHTNDVARALLLLMKRRSRNLVTVNIASGEEQSVRGVVRAFSSAMKMKLILKSAQKKRRPSDRAHLRADLSLLRRLTRFKPRLRFEEGIRDLLETEEVLQH